MAKAHEQQLGAPTKGYVVESTRGLLLGQLSGCLYGSGRHRWCQYALHPPKKGLARLSST